ncbi:hypothetical protein HanIR_Chr17g0873461 [Helianthus annuus]|nr:hypothetical protein HanIR_Chr17g0873461 [Helianthus annuus]
MKLETRIPSSAEPAPYFSSTDAIISSAPLQLRRPPSLRRHPRRNSPPSPLYVHHSATLHSSAFHRVPCFWCYRMK